MQLESRRSEGAALEAGGEPAFFVTGDRARGEFRCAGCGYGVTVRTTLPVCPMCRGLDWEEPATRSSPRSPV